MQRHGIPCAKSASFSDIEQAREYVRSQKSPVWIKADGLAAGKGVIVAESVTEAEGILDSMMQVKSFGTAGEKVVVEEPLIGREMSYFVFT